MLYTFTDDIDGDSNGNRYFASASKRKETGKTMAFTSGQSVDFKAQNEKKRPGERRF
jgi:hypothetical protein